MQDSRHANFYPTMMELEANIVTGKPLADSNTSKLIEETKRLIKLARPNKKAPTDEKIIEVLSRHIKEESPQNIGGGLVQDISGAIGNMLGNAIPYAKTIGELMLL